MIYAPVALFLYNRPAEARQTIDRLRENYLSKETSLYVFVDGPKHNDNMQNIYEVRSIANGIIGFKETYISISTNNLGLAKSIISGVSHVLKKHDTVIVLEDDLVTSKYFLKFINECLCNFRYRKDVLSISGFSYDKQLLKLPKNHSNDIFLSKRASSHGWGTWADRWERIDWDISRYYEKRYDIEFISKLEEAGSDLEKMMLNQNNGSINSWAVRFVLHQLENDLYTVYPRYSFVYNIGFGDSATHTKGKNGYLDTRLNQNWYPKKIEQNLEPNKEILKHWPNIFRSKRRFKLKNIKKAIKKYLQSI